MGKADKERHDKALAVLGQSQRVLMRRLTGYVLENEESLRLASEGAEGYGYTLHQLDELFLSRLNLVERAIAELQKSPARGVSRYRTLCFSASRGAVEKEINRRLAKMPESRILGVSVSPKATDGVAGDDGHAAPESAQESAPERPVQTPVSRRRPARGREEPAGAPASNDDLLVTVLYYGPAAAR